MLTSRFTDASAEDRWEGLGGVVFSGSLRRAQTFRVDDAPSELGVYLPSLSDQKVRIAQLELLAVLIFVRLFGEELSGSYVRFHIDNVSAMYCCLNGYSGNSFMARLSGELWMLLLSYNIVPWFQYVPSKLNVADIFSRPNRKAVGRRLQRRHHWRSVSPTSTFSPLRRRLDARPEVAWGLLHRSLESRLHSGRHL